MSLRIAPPAAHATSTTNTSTTKLTNQETNSISRGAPSAPGLPDKIRSSHATNTTTTTTTTTTTNDSSSKPLVSSTHPLEARLSQWQQTQSNLRSQLLRRNFGIALPLRMSMEQDMVRKADSFRPSVLGQPSRVHEDILTGRDAEIAWEDVYNGQDGLRGVVDVGGDGSGASWIDEMETKVGMGKW